MLGFGLLVNSSTKFLSIFKKNKTETLIPIFEIIMSILITIIGLMVLLFPVLGYYILLLMVAFALMINGVEIIYIGMKKARFIN